MHDAHAGFEELRDEAGSSFDWQLYYHAVLERLWIVAVAVVVGVAVAGWFLKNQEVFYRARAVLLFEPEKEKILNNVEAVRDAQVRSDDMVNTVVATLRSYPFALRVAKRLGLGGSAEFADAVRSGAAGLTPEQAAGHLVGMVSVEHRKGTRLIDVSVRSRVESVSVTLANAYAEEYLRLLLEQSTDATKSAGQFLVEEAARLGEKVRLAEEALQSFRERERASSFETLLASAQLQVGTVTEEIGETRKELDQLRADLAVSAQNPEDEKFLLQLPSIANDAQIRSLNAAIDEQKTGLDLLGQRYLPEHPAFATAQKRMNNAMRDRTELIQRIVSQLHIRERLAAEDLKRLEGVKQEAERRLLEVTGKSVEYNALTRELEADRALYGAVLERLKEVDLTKGMSDVSFRLQEPAFGATPIPVPYAKMLLLGLAGGLAAGVGLALGLNALDPSMKTVEQAERWTGLSVITAVPQLKGREAGLVAVAERQGVVAEAFRTLRTSIALVGGRDQRQVFLFTSALPSEGKTFTSANFAATLAQQGFRTLIIDGDLRKPSVSQLFFGEHRKPGLAEVIQGEVALEAAVRDSGVKNLSVLTAGGQRENPSELLAGPGVKEVFESVRQTYDRIVVDSAPVIAVSDTLLMLGHVDVNCLVVRANSTPKKSVQHAIGLLEGIGCAPAGVILNCLKVGRGGSYAYAYSGRAYGGYGKRVYGAASGEKS
jgi:capsular exopolysaccharide synthesis family protein